MSSHVEHAADAERSARVALDAADAALATSEANERAAKSALDAATAMTPDKELAALVSRAHAAQTRTSICRRARDNAARALEAAMRASIDASHQDALVALHRNGVEPICALEREARALEAQAAALRQRQAEIFNASVAPLNAPWAPVYASEYVSGPPANVYPNVATVVARHYQENTQ